MVRTGLLALMLGAAGCASDGAESLLILNNSVPGDDCSLTAGGTGQFLSRGLIDTQADLGYIFTPLVENATVSTTNNRRLALIEGANISLTFQDESKASSNSSFTEFSQLFSGSIEADGGIAVFGFEIVPHGLLEEMDGKLGDGDRTVVTARVTLFGEINGGAIESNEFAYPIEVCKGCTISVVGDCTSLPEAFSARSGGACQPLQDGFLDCCTHEGNQICPAMAVAPEG